MPACPSASDYPRNQPPFFVNSECMCVYLPVCAERRNKGIRCGGAVYHIMETVALACVLRKETGENVRYVTYLE